MDSKEILAIFGYSETSELTPEDREYTSNLTLSVRNTVIMTISGILVLYTTYLKICVDGIQALQYYDVKDRRWPSWETDRPVV